MSLYYTRVPVKELTSKKAVLRFAAELVAKNMEAEKDPDYRVGCCATFNRMSDAVGQEHSLNYWQKRSILDLIIGARNKFSEMYRQDGIERTRDSVYWMGTRSDMGQKRRISALLAAAEAV